MTSIPTPYTHVGYTTEELHLACGPRNCWPVSVPAGTQCVLLKGPGTRWVVNDLRFLSRNSIVYHDADHYGIDVDAGKLRDIREVS